MFQTDTIIDYLKASSIFRHLNETEIDDLLRSSELITVQQGETLYSQNEEAASFYVLLSGKIKVYRVGPSGSEKVIDIVKKGDVFAEAMIFSREKAYQTTAEALTDSQVLAIKIRAYCDLLRQRPELCFDVMELLSVRLHGLFQEIERLSLQNAKERLIHYLLASVPGDNDAEPKITLDIPKRVLASRLSMLPETLSRVLHNLAREQVIKVDSRVIVLKDIEGLKARCYH